MTETPVKNPGRRIVIGCVLLFVMGGVVPAVLFVVLVTGFLREHGIGGPDKEAIALEAKYGETAQELITKLEMETQRVKTGGAEARAALPDDAIISADWDAQVEMRKAWRKVDHDTFLPFVYYLAREEEYDFEEGMDELRAHLKPLRNLGKLTVLEDRFDPNVRSNEEVLESFKDFVLELKVLDEMEAAIDYGIWPMSREDPDAFEDYDDRFSMGRRLLCRRAIVLAERGDTDHAMATCRRLCKLHALMLEDPESDQDQCAGALCSASAAMELLAKHMSDDTAYYAFLAECAASLPPEEAYTARLGMAAVASVGMYGTANPLPTFMKGDPQKRLYRAIGQAEAFAELLRNPTEENEAKSDAIEDRFEPDFGDDSEEDESITETLIGVYSGELMEDFDSQTDTWELERCFGSLSHSLMHKDSIAIALALRDCKKKTGAYPESLEALTPEPFAAVPRHRITGKPYIYSREGDGYGLWRPPSTPDEDEEEAKPMPLWKMER